MVKNKEMKELDVLKYGFVLKEDKDNLKTYELVVEHFSDFTIVLYVLAGVYSIYFWHGDYKTYVANRYRCETQEELDFLITKGRIAWVFESVIK